MIRTKRKAKGLVVSLCLSKFTPNRQSICLTRKYIAFTRQTLARLNCLEIRVSKIVGRKCQRTFSTLWSFYNTQTTILVDVGNRPTSRYPCGNSNFKQSGEFPLYPQRDVCNCNAWLSVTGLLHCLPDWIAHLDTRNMSIVISNTILLIFIVN